MNVMVKSKPPVAERLLARREAAGGSLSKHARYHVLVTRYQKLVLRRYMLRRLGRFWN